MSDLRKNNNEPGDEESLRRESFPVSVATPLKIDFFSQGELSSSSEIDIYFFDILGTGTGNTPAGSYTVTLTSDKDLYGWSTNNEAANIQFEIRDFNNFLNIVHESSPISTFDDAVTFSTDGTQQLYVYVKGDGRPVTGDYAIAVENYTGPDLEAPKLVNFTVDKQRLASDNQIAVQFHTTDKLSGVKEISFTWTDATGENQRFARTAFSEKDETPDDPLVFTLPSDLQAGSYFLSRIDVKDNANNSSQYYRAGALADNITSGDLPNHSLETNFRGGDFVLAGVSDLEAPRLASFSVDTSSVSSQNEITVNYSASDNLSGVRSATFTWTDATGVNQRFARVAFSGKDETPSDGSYTFTIPSDVQGGNYFLSRVLLRDDSSSVGNTITYYRGGSAF
ncbi:hypothetical protein OAN59_10925 [Alphaproteobacteria bacterium]|nr:hypothetical protein [Alphaproteobacteria bacterium]